MRKIIWLLLFASYVHAQEPKIWFENAGGLFSRDCLSNGTVKYCQGFWGDFKIQKLIQNKPEALALFEKHEKFYAYTHLTYWLGVLPSSLIFSVGLGLKNIIMAIISGTTLVGTGFLAIYFQSKSRHYLLDAVNSYNSVYEQQQGSANLVNLSFDF